jgi:hypothetical protein
MFVFFGIIVFLVGIFVTFIAPKIKLKSNQGGTDLMLDDRLGSWSKYSFTIIILGILLIFSNAINPFSLNMAGNRQVVQTIGGDLSTRFEPGLYYSGFLSTVTTYPNNITIQVGPEEKKSKETNYWSLSNTGTFSEGDQAQMGHTVKWDLPVTQRDMIDLHITYNNIDNLATTTLMQYQRETASYSCQRMTSETHYSGGQSQLKDYFQDQLRNGQVLLESETKSQIQSDGTSRTYIEVNAKTDAKGITLRTIGDVQRFQLRPSFVSIDHIVYDERIIKKLKEKIDAAAEEATSKQKLITAQQKEQTAIVEGREKIAQVKSTEEAEEQKSVIQARKVKLVSKEEAEQAKYVADKIEQEGRAQAATNKALVAAGLTPVQQMERDIKIADVVSKNISGASTPQVVIMGGDGGSANEVMKIFGAERSLELIKKMSNKDK